MTPHPLDSSRSRTTALLYCVAICIVLVFVYRDALIYDYYFADDVWTYPDRIYGRSGYTYLSHGRPVTDILIYLSAYTYFVFDSAQLARGVSLALLAALAICFFFALQKAWKPWQAFAVALAIALLPSFQIHVTYARMFTYFVAYILAYFAVEIISRQKIGLIHWFAFGAIVVIDYHIFQACPFFILVFLLIQVVSWTELTRERVVHLAKVVVVLAVLVAASAVAHAVAVQLSGSHVYKKAESVMGVLVGDWGALGGLLQTPATNVFEVWSYAWPVPALGETQGGYLHLAAFGLLSVLVALRYYRSTHRALDGTVIGLALLFFLASMIPVAASLFDGRQHLYAAPQSILLIMFFWALYGLTASPIVTGAIVAATVISTAIGFGQKLVYPHVFALDYARAAIADRPLSEKLNIVVIKPSLGAQRCQYEPCSGYYGRNLNALLRGRYIFTKGKREQNEAIGEVTVVSRRDAPKLIEGLGDLSGYRIVDVGEALAEYRKRHRL